MAIEERDIQAGGVLAHARTCGEGGGTLVLIHGAEADGSMWEPYMEGLARDRRVLALDLPGHGGSGIAADMDCSPAGIARWFSEVLDAEGVGTAGILGHSFGGMVAFNVALEAPSRVSHLVGVSVANPTWATEAFRKGAYRLMDALASGDLDEATARVVLAGIYRKDSDSEGIVEGAASWSEPGVMRFFAQGGSEFARPLPVWRLRELTVPTLLIWGGHDRFLPVDEVRQGTMYIPDSRMVVIDDAAHFPFVDAPDTFYMAVDAFMYGGDRDP